MQKILVGLWIKIFYVFNFKFTETKFLHNYFGHNLCKTLFIADTGNNRKFANFTCSCLYARPINEATPKQLLYLST